ncbi:hypothetical protein PBY51_003076 [Eleginops maclovinus]|uniref:Uncharacterized protein n=1 Tax=Eleginops maclovinus TaxID=56733 RepID=A0AAN7X7D9_ELEMC|nr:hypothetical protein PBY51_003076 [Eleginops maclovinus]
MMEALLCYFEVLIRVMEGQTLPALRRTPGLRKEPWEEGSEKTEKEKVGEGWRQGYLASVFISLMSHI